MEKTDEQKRKERAERFGINLEELETSKNNSG